MGGGGEMYGFSATIFRISLLRVGTQFFVYDTVTIWKEKVEQFISLSTMNKSLATYSTIDIINSAHASSWQIFIQKFIRKTPYVYNTVCVNPPWRPWCDGWKNGRMYNYAANRDVLLGCTHIPTYLSLYQHIHGCSCRAYSNRTSTKLSNNKAGNYVYCPIRTLYIYQQ